MNTWNTFDEQFKTFHKCLSKHYKDGGQRLYNPADMEKFANKCTPGLFNHALCLVKNDEKQQLSQKRHKILRLRVVALLHQLSYFRNQVCITIIKNKINNTGNTNNDNGNDNNNNNNNNNNSRNHTLGRHLN